ncbi:pleckstrin like proteiny domain-containing family B member 1 isoform X1 [Amazona aestiva]|uniref:Pleckstrin like proteiny domain-containing family B member 1 isoform X1 n=1 Tax=Amazona aestiva TaxID=12930 RepID=A0A0Q3QSB6_AMAAE|nr:pleckstrin like proteiny domain-containing family B member 1 isoform X1 [Amazona aestiva]
MALVKSGWLWRQSSILRRWKRNWFVLYLDGSLVYYHDETQRDMDGRIHIKYSCRDVHVYDPYDDDYYQTVPLDSHQAAYISSGHYGPQHGAPGVTHVIVREDPYRVSGDQMALGLLAGAATGAALGSFMWMPCWF